MSYIFAALLRLVLALVAVLGTPAHHTTPAPAPVHVVATPAPRPVHHPAPATSPRTPAQARALVARYVATHHGHVAQWGTYGYGARPGQYTALNAGVWAQVGPGQCVGYETYGSPGFFGNVWGLNSGDCN